MLCGTLMLHCVGTVAWSRPAERRKPESPRAHHTTGFLEPKAPWPLGPGRRFNPEKVVRLGRAQVVLFCSYPWMQVPASGVFFSSGLGSSARQRQSTPSSSALRATPEQARKGS